MPPSEMWAPAGVIAVTGASRGIGSAIARELAARGHVVACLSRKGAGPEDASGEELPADRLPAYACDVTDEAGLAEALFAAARDGGGLRGLVNNAGVHREGPSAEFSGEAFMEVMATNALSVFNACRIARPLLIDAGGGLVVNIGSYYDRLGIPRNAAYCASKAAIGAITRCLAVEWARDGIRVLDVAPGFIATDLNAAHRETEGMQRYVKRRIPVGRAGEPGEVARLVAALFGEDIGFVTGTTIYIDGANGVAV